MELKSCPICGSNSIAKYEEGPARHKIDTNEWDFTDFPFYSLECEICGHLVIDDSPETVSKKWNSDGGNDIERRLWQFKEQYIKSNN